MLNEEQKEIRTLAREFAEGEFRPNSTAWDEASAYDPQILAKLAELGFMGMLVPEEFGGLGFDGVTYLVALEQMAWGDASVAYAAATQNGMVPRLLLRLGTLEQKQEWLPALAAGERLVGHTSCDVPDVCDVTEVSGRTQATRDGDDWVLSGTEPWVFNGEKAHAVLVFAVTDGSTTEAPSLSAFLVDPSLDGYVVGKRQLTLGFKASEFVSVTMDGLRVPGNRLLGEVGKGLEYLLDVQIIARLSMAAEAVGIAQAAMEHSLKYANERRQFGLPISDFGAIRGKLAGMAVRVGAARSLVLDVGRRYQAYSDQIDAGSVEGDLPLHAAAAAAKLLASETAYWVADEAVQIFGGYGYMRDYPVEKLMRDAKGTEILEGTNEHQRLVIGREVVTRALE